MLQSWWALDQNCLAGLDPNLLWLLQKQHGYSDWFASVQTKGDSYLKVEEASF